MHLTQRVIDSLTFQQAGANRDVRWDELLPGFGIRLYPSGRKTFVVNYRAEGVQRLMKVGVYGQMTLEEARKRARAHLVAVADGIDPLKDRRRAASAQTVREVCHEYVEKYAKVRKKTWKDDARTIERYILPRWGTCQLRSIKRPDVLNVHRQLGVKHPYAANRLAEIISRIFEIAKDWGILEENFPNPARKIKPHREVQRDRFVTQEEMPRLATAIDEEANPHLRGAFWLYLYTGLRKRELLRARWTDIDFNAGIWRVPETKSGRVHYLPLIPQVSAVLTALPRLEGNPYVIPGLRTGQPLDNLDKAWRRIRARAHLTDVRIHDLRRTAGSHMAHQGVSLHLIGQLLNHRDPSTTAIYARFQQRHLSEALKNYADKLSDMSYTTTDARVVALKHS